MGVLLAQFVGCTETREGRVDADVVADAGATSPDVQTVDAAPSADVAVQPDGPVAVRDAFVPRESCNTLDDDGDFRVDESPTTCGDVPGGDEAVCLVDGVCACRHPAVRAHPGSFEDCNADWTDGCETRLGTRTNCARCGDLCPGIENECSETAEGGLACRPIGILDLSVSRDDGDITCVVALDHRVICRGPNTEHAISDIEPETATLGWTVVDLPPSTSVHASLRVRSDGSDVLSICTTTTDHVVACRGDNGTGLLGYGDDIRRSGYHRILFPADVVSMLSWGGDAYVLLDIARGRFRPNHVLHRWGGAGRNRSPELVYSYVFEISIGDMPAASTFDDASSTRPAFPLMMWGPHRSGLSQMPAGTPDWESPQPIEHSPHLSKCFRNLCCGGWQTGIGPRAIVCWGRTPTDDWSWSTLGAAIPASTVELASGTYTIRDVPPSGELYDQHFLAPDGAGGTRVCGRYQYRIDDAAPYRNLLACGDAAAIDDSGWEGGTVAAIPEMSTADAYARSRVDWQAMCLQHAPNDWQCWGAHDGWGHPAIP